MKLHPYCKIFPEITGTEFAALVADIKANGLRQKIMLLDGEILDGRNRWLACDAAGVAPEFQDFNGDDPLSFVVSHNMVRRHLTQSQAAMVAVEIANARRGRPDKSLNSSINTEAQVADAMHVSVSSVQAAKRVKKGDKKLAAKVKAGEMSLHAAEVAMRPAMTPETLADAVPQPIKRSARDESEEMLKQSLVTHEPDSITVADVNAWLDTPEGEKWKAAQLAANRYVPNVEDVTVAIVEEWLKTPHGQEWLDSDARPAAPRCEDVTVALVEEWLATDTGKQWHVDEITKFKAIAAKQPLTPAAVTAWIFTEDGQRWKRDFDKQHASASILPPQEKNDGKTITIKVGPPLTLSHLTEVLRQVTKLIPKDADHAKFADVLSTAAAAELVAARKPKDLMSAYV